MALASSMASTLVLMISQPAGGGGVHGPTQINPWLTILKFAVCFNLRTLTLSSEVAKTVNLPLG